MTGKPGPHIGRRAEQVSYLGDRSTMHGGYWAYCRDRISGSCPVKSEIFAVLDSIPGQEKFLAKATWERLRTGAERGRLRMGERGDVAVIQRVPDLLELRVQVNPQHRDVGKRHLLRLYFAEPAGHERLLLALKFGRKPGSGDPGGRQDMHINEARHRYEDGSVKGHGWGIRLEC